MMRLMIRFFLLASLTGLAAPAVQAATLFGIVSERSAADLAAGAGAFTQKHPGHSIILRSTGQLREMDDAALKDLLHRADVAVAFALFGDTAQRLEKILADDNGARPFIAASSDGRLTVHAEKRVTAGVLKAAK